MYTIYHIQGIKIGCATQPKKRVQEQGYKEFNILEQHNDIYVASDREQELQKQYGYEVDECPYWKTYEQNIERRNKVSKEQRNAYSKMGGNKNVESGWMKEWQQRSVITRTGTKHSDESKMKMRLARLGKYTYPCKAVMAFDKENNFIGEYNSASTLAKTLGLLQGNVSSVLNHKLKTTGGYIIKYKV
jgi:hypothetical protein